MIDLNARAMLLQRERDNRLRETIKEAFNKLKLDKPESLIAPIQSVSDATNNQAVLQAFTVQLLQEISDSLKDLSNKLDELKKVEVMIDGHE